MKKILSGILVMMLLFSCSVLSAIPTNAAEINVNYDDFDIIDGVIIEYIGNGGEVIVPSVDKDGEPITKIDEKAFAGNTSVTAVYICEGITDIGGFAFQGCYNLTEVSMPYSLKNLGGSAFRLTSLGSVVIPGQVDSIKNSTFCNISKNSKDDAGNPLYPDALDIKLEDVIISEGVQEILTGAFFGVMDTEIIIPESVWKVEGLAFQYNTIAPEIYICNKDCIIGSMEKEVELNIPGTVNFITYSGKGPIMVTWENCKDTIKIYGDKDSAELRNSVNSWAEVIGEGKLVFVNKSATQIAEKQKECVERGIVAPTKWVMNADGTVAPDVEENPNSSGTNNSNNNTGNAVDNGNNTTIVIIICASVLLVIIIICVMVVVLVTLNSKKKKKKKKKIAAPVAAQAEEAEIPATEDNANE